MKLFCLGDSLTFGFGVPRSVRWTTLVEEKTGWQVINHGINGDTTGGMLARLGPEVLAQIDRERLARLNCRILVMGGSNDVFFSGTDAQARANMAAICQRLMGEGLDPLVGISLPVDWRNAPRRWSQVVDFEHAAQVMDEYCAWVKRFCQVFGLNTVEFAQDFIDADGQVKHELFLDGLHPNREGHRLMAQRLEQSLLPRPN